jgi:uncharacterized protein YndB with AHSA1/START domain
MKTFQTSILIHARTETIWSLLTDAPGYPGWNSTVAKVEGEIVPRGRIRVHAKAAPGQAFPLRVTEYVAGHRMVWTGGMPLGLFVGTRIFTLDTVESGDTAESGHTAESGAVRFGMVEGFAGVLAPLIARSIPDLQPSFDQFAADLRRAAEHATS